ncbi:MAG TPA: glycoside hydrolase family 97 protein, partial [Chitinophagaceae bacterium]|nr:glycoside hydrolase family 97 protein [Chitinophagaceae bacterium]
MKPVYCLLCCCFFIFPGLAADSLTLLSPDRSIRVSIHTGNTPGYSIFADNKAILLASAIDLLLKDGRRLSGKPAIQSTAITTVNQNIVSPVPEKKRNISDHYNQLFIRFKHGFAVVFRVYNDGVAYRIITYFKDSIFIKQEIADFHFPAGSGIIAPLMQQRTNEDKYHTSFEELYVQKPMDSVPENSLMYSPLLIDETDIKIALTESDLDDYPGMFLKTAGGFSLTADFAPFPLEETITSETYAEKIVTKRADFIAHTKGSRQLPWRVLVIARSDKDLPANDLVYRLAAPSVIADPSWIHPGKCTDEWIIDINLFNVPFKTGINTASYKYYIDFARRFGFNRIMMDAGWSDPKNLFSINPDVNMDTLSAYAREKGIKISMWTLALTLDRQLDSALTQFDKWGVDFIMTDFIDRDDQKAVQFYPRIAAACAKHKMMIMFHGSFAPKGFNRTYPNNITREGVLGSEYNAWSNKPSPEHDLILPFTRMLAGPMDYEPGILDNATEIQFKPVWGKVMSQGTRCHQLAMFAVYDNPLQIFSGNPSQGYMEPAFMELLGSIPSTWDSTIIVAAKVADYIITARKKEDDWFIGGMTDWTARSFDIPL